MGVVDDVHRGLDRELRANAGAGGAAAQQKYRADLDGFVLRKGRTGQRNRFYLSADEHRMRLRSSKLQPLMPPRASSRTHTRGRQIMNCPASGRLDPDIDGVAGAGIALRIVEGHDMSG